MILSNEPGYYEKGKFGIRIENLIRVKKIKKGIAFEDLTMAPIDKELIDKSLLKKEEIHWLNSYHKKVFKNLKKSKIFLSFSELEGLPLPPVEAALAGNQVIGYTGEGGKEYWRKPIFTEIKTGELKIFCREILRKIKIKNFLKKTKKQRVYLANQFSSSKEKVSIKNFLKLI